MATSRSVVIAALIANGAISVLKFVGFLLTGSAAMLSETYHSISDTGNQVFLLIGLRFGARERSREHPFGYGKAQFFYSFLVSVLLFMIAGWESLKHGWGALQGEAHLPHGSATLPVIGTFDAVYVNYVVLLGAIAFEAWAFKKAHAAIRLQMDEHGWATYREAFVKTADVTTLTALTEDAIALAGAGIALFAVYLTRTTGDPIFDAVGAMLIGAMLMGFALALAWENKRLLLGESLPASDERELRRVVEDCDGVREIVDFRTVYFGPEYVIVTADVRLDDDLDAQGVDECIAAIEEKITAANAHVQKVYVEPEV